MSKIETHSGLMLDFLEPREEMIHPDDIALGLSRMPRYAGQFSSHHQHYSVAEHSILVYQQVKKMGGSKEEQRWALLHDSCEAYTGDVPSPLKRLLPDYQAMEDQLMDVISGRFLIGLAIPEIVLAVDAAMVPFERAHVMNKSDNDWGLKPRMGIHPSLKPLFLSPREAYEAYRAQMKNIFTPTQLRGK